MPLQFWKKESSTMNTNSNDHSNGDAKKNKDKVNYKAILEKKQYLATVNPEPVYDLSDCGLKNVPGGVYTNCKIQRKEALLLQDNELVTLTGGGSFTDLGACLQVLDLHNNHLEKLPDEIGLLKQLRVLHLHHNRLKKIPEKLKELKLLQNLDVSHNVLKDLPEVIFVDLKRLKSLNLSANPKLKKLPKSIGLCQSLQTLKAPDPATLQYPPADVVKEGTDRIMKFLAKECDIQYINPTDYVPPEVTIDSVKIKNGFTDEDPYEKLVKGNLQLIEKQKEEKMKEIARLERERQEVVARETAMAASVATKKKELLIDLANEEAKRDDVVRKMQQMKDKEKEMLVSTLHNAENRTDALINELMASHHRASDPAKVLEEIERERKEMEEMFSSKSETAVKLREEEIKSAMMSVMEEEMKREELRRKYEEGKQWVIDSALTSELENDRAVEEVLSAQGKQKSALMVSLLEDEKYQREAFAALLLKQDSRHKQISSQVKQIQDELASLTMVEMTKRDLQVEFENDLMRGKRETLTNLLMNLLEQQKERQDELTKRMQEMEGHRNAETENYWLIQYQKLLDSRPKSVVKAEEKLDPGLKEILAQSGTEEFAPIFALRGISSKQIVYMRDRELEELGLHNTYLRQKLMKVAEDYQAKHEAVAAKLGADVKGGSEPSAPPAVDELPPQPSAPVDEMPLPSAPPTEEGAALQPIETFQSSECVVCLESKCDILFLPCGHVCCCWRCENTLKECPLCRADINQKVKLRLG